MNARVFVIQLLLAALLGLALQSTSFLTAKYNPVKTELSGNADTDFPSENDSFDDDDGGLDDFLVDGDADEFPLLRRFVLKANSSPCYQRNYSTVSTPPPRI
jgi:hypothetical protein